MCLVSKTAQMLEVTENEVFLLAAALCPVEVFPNVAHSQWKAGERLAPWAQWFCEETLQLPHETPMPSFRIGDALIPLKSFGVNHELHSHRCCQHCCFSDCGGCDSLEDSPSPIPLQNPPPLRWIQLSRGRLS